jgi:hypothetical protein
MKPAGNAFRRCGERISTGSEDGWRTIRISDAGPGKRAALAGLGFPPDLVQRYPPGTRYFDRAVANLRQAVGEMAARKPAGWSVQFRDLLSRTEQARVPLAVVGSVALAIRGIDVCPGDIDVITTLEGADALAESYRDALVVPLFTSPGFGRFGRAFTGRDPRRVARQPRQSPGRPMAARCRRMVDRQPLRGSPVGEPALARAAAGTTASGGSPASATRSSRGHRRVPRNPQRHHLKQGHWAGGRLTVPCR